MITIQVTVYKAVAGAGILLIVLRIAWDAPAFLWLRGYRKRIVLKLLKHVTALTAITAVLSSLFFLASPDRPYTVGWTAKNTGELIKVLLGGH